MSGSILSLRGKFLYQYIFPSFYQPRWLTGEGLGIAFGDDSLNILCFKNNQIHLHPFCSQPFNCRVMYTILPCIFKLIVYFLYSFVYFFIEIAISRYESGRLLEF